MVMLVWLYERLYLNSNECFIKKNTRGEILLKVKFIYILFLFILTACSTLTQTPISDEVAFVGKGEYWSAKYIFDPDLYNEKHLNWVEIEYIGDEPFQLDPYDIDMEFKGTDGTLAGNLGEMKTKVEKNNISFLVGTINREASKEDEYELTISTNGKKDVIKLMLKD